MRTGFDISNPEQMAIGGFDVAGGYLGGATPHVWTRQQWERQPARYRSLFWLPEPGKRYQDTGQEIAAACEALGVPQGVIIWLDMETQVNPGLVNEVAAEVHHTGRFTGVYGSESTVFGNPPRSGYMVARYDGVARLYEHPHSIAKQYQHEHRTIEGAVVDLDVYGDHVPLWDTRPQPVTVRPPWASAVLNDLAAIITAAGQAQHDLQHNVK